MMPLKFRGDADGRTLLAWAVIAPLPLSCLSGYADRTAQQ
jgi:hypothetical protein